MERERWHQMITIAVIASLVLALVGIGIGIKALTKSSNNPTTTPVAAMVYPTNGATVSGTAALDARPLSTVVTSISVVATGGSLHDTQIASLALSFAGWIARWDTTTVSNGTYQIAAVAYDASGHSSQSSPVNVTVKN